MSIQRGSIFVLALALCMMVGLLPIQAVVPVFSVPEIISIAGANPEEEGSVFDDPAAEDPDGRIAPEAGADNELLRTEDDAEGEMGEPINDFDPIPGEDGYEGIVPITDDLLLDDDLDADEEADDAVTNTGGGIFDTWIPAAIAAVVLIICGIGAYFLATKSPKQPKVQ
ncbi:MAG: hypothetical protein FWD93_00805 [Coriobacteriia bacterium]|nr:hypothetical protein [Coriobacteriia bacterium]